VLSSDNAEKSGAALALSQTAERLGLSRRAGTQPPVTPHAKMGFLPRSLPVVLTGARQRLTQDRGRREVLDSRGKTQYRQGSVVPSSAG